MFEVFNLIKSFYAVEKSEVRPKRKAGGSSGIWWMCSYGRRIWKPRPISVSAWSCSVDTGPPRREDEAEQIESSHKDARCLLEPDPRGAGKRGKHQDIWGYHNIDKGDLMALTIEMRLVAVLEVRMRRAKGLAWASWYVSLWLVGGSLRLELTYYGQEVFRKTLIRKSELRYDKLFTVFAWSYMRILTNKRRQDGAEQNEGSNRDEIRIADPPLKSWPRRQDQKWWLGRREIWYP